MPLSSVTLILSPYHVGNYNVDVGAGPLRVLNHGLISALEELGVKVKVEEIPRADTLIGEIGKSFELLRRTSKLVRQAKMANSFPIILSGNCMATVGVAAGIGAADLGCVWFDAHDDYHTPDTMMSGYLDSTGVSMMSGESFKALMGTVPGHEVFDLQRFIFCGIRDVTGVERKRVQEGGMGAVWGGTDVVVDFAQELGKAIDRRPSKATMIHLDLDVLDDSLGKVNRFSAPGGLFEADLQACLRTIVEKTIPASLTVASFDPSLDGGDVIVNVAVNAITTVIKSLLEKKLLTV
ncbi:Arginase/deacetylase [Rhizodiscina lignyota]|uniref:Arginase/deacetylase n=1 Tax=Rhizodiscina lignyota TaxID=1504668 RepID=A0A9P4M7F3_9PEZI|nr:Arginase/deacetylase [Rhizodiscina lignyota]